MEKNKILKKVFKSMNEFGYKLYHKVSVERSAGNFLFAPPSVYGALSIILRGACEGTANEMIEGMGLSEVMKMIDIERFHKLLGEECSKILKTNSNSDGSLKLKVINKLWLPLKMEVKEGFVKAVKEYYGVEIDFVDFIDNPQSAWEEINSWICDSSEGMISRAVSEDYGSIQIRFFIANLMFFEGLWLSPFDIKETINLQFHVSSCSNVFKPKFVDMMFQETYFAFIKSTKYDCKVLLLKYRNSSIHMVILLPNKLDGINDLEMKIVNEGVEDDIIYQWVSDAEKEVVRVYLPRFRISHRFNILTSLQRLGFNNLFTEDANLLGMTQDNTLHINGFCHEACIEVDEKGTKAAAVDSKKQIIAAGQKGPSEFKADHPFLFCIYDQDTELISAWGRFCCPEFDRIT